MATKLRILERLGFFPTLEQRTILESRARLRLVAGGERAGKSRSGSADVLADAMRLARREQGKVLVWLVGDRYEDSRQEFGYIAGDLSGLGILQKVSHPSYGPCYALGRWDGAAIEVETKSARHPETLRAKAPHFVLGCEAAAITYEAFLRLLGRLSEHKGKLLLTGTFEEAYGWYPELWQAWQIPGAEGVSFSLPTWSNTYIFPEGRDDPEIKRLARLYGEVPGLFEARCGGIPTPPVGLVFREFSHLIHVDPDCIYVPGSPVYLGIDPSRGVNPYAVVVCQTRMGDEIRVIDEIYERGKICEEIIDLCKGREADEERGIEAIEPKAWWKDVKGGAIGHDAPDDRERWGRLAGVWLASKNIKEEHLIRRIKTFLYSPDDGPARFGIAPRCQNTIREFTKWRRADNNKPIDADNHAPKGLGYWVINMFGFVEEMGRPKRVSYARPDLRAITRREW